MFSFLNIKKKKCFVFDIDGTIANHIGLRSPYDESKVYDDTVIESVAKVLKQLSKKYRIIFLSGRTKGCQLDTHRWIRDKLKYSGPIYLYMREIGDKRKDDIIKWELYNTYVFPKYNVIGVFDDRLQVCRMLYKNNVFVFNVNQGLREF